MRFINFMPRLYEATSVPSVVAMRHDEVALGVFAVDAQRAGKADRDLGHPGEIFDVAFGRVRIERILARRALASCLVTCSTSACRCLMMASL